MIKGTAIFILNSRLEFLAGERCNTNHYAGFIGLPGGKNEPDETYEQAIVRETEEETGIIIASSDDKQIVSMSLDWMQKQGGYQSSPKTKELFRRAAAMVMQCPHIERLGEPVTYDESGQGEGIICQWYYIVTDVAPTKTDGKVHSWQRYSLSNPPPNMMPGSKEKIAELKSILGIVDIQDMFYKRSHNV